MQRVNSAIGNNRDSLESPNMEMVPLTEVESEESSYSEKLLDLNTENDEINRVLIYATCYNVLDGVTITIRKLEREILATGGSVCILTTTSGCDTNTNLVPPHKNRRVLFMDNSIPIPFQSDPNDPSVSYHIGISLSKNTEEQVDDFKPNIIHITAPDFTSLHVHNYARKRQIPLMGTYHSNIPEYALFVPGFSWVKPVLERLFQHIYNFLSRLYVPTPFIRSRLIDGQQMDRITEIGIWGRGVDLDRFKPQNRSETFRSNLNIPPDCPIVLYVGRLVPEKRPDIVANVVKRLTAENINFRCIIVGAGPADHLIENLPNTHALGWMSGDKLTEVYASSDIFLFPSSVETFGNVTLEAAASGLPLVVEAKCSGHLVDDGENGYACEAGNADEFFKGTLELCCSEEKRKAFSKKSLEKSSSLEQSKVVRGMLDNYKEVRKDFYEKYGGNHYNRDEAYRHEGSFRMGLDPRPFGWFIVEFTVLFVLKTVNWGLAVATWTQDRYGSNTHYSGTNGNNADGDDESDIEAQQPSTDIEENEEVGPGFLCNILTVIGDSHVFASIIMGIIHFFMLIVRLISIARRGCAKRLCSKTFESIEHRMDAAFSTNHEKRRD